MEQLNAELVRVSAERKRLQRQATGKETRLRARRERALRVGTIAFCHDPTAGSSLANAILRKYRDCVALDVSHCATELESRFLDTPVGTLAQWFDWEGQIPEQEMLEAKRLVEEVRLLSWVQTQNHAQGVSPPPQFVWEKRCALSIANSSSIDARASSYRPPRSAAAKKWMQRFRQRWGLVLGRRPTSDMLSVDIMRSKVDLFFILDTSFTESLSVLGSGKWTRFRVCKHKSSKRGCQKHGTFFVCFSRKGDGFVAVVSFPPCTSSS